MVVMVIVEIEGRLMILIFATVKKYLVGNNNLPELKSTVMVAILQSTKDEINDWQ